ncbi:MAG: 23S rRNA (uracil(1939)-C(5))-methyltransferase RlmD [Eubacterium sp.]|nr:23S rRNA (uracil(1939)-C(5))-methyltransferase RlmD [Eubacterium sp.]
MKKNDIITLEITSLTSEGSGVGRYDGMAVFVPFSAPGDKLKCRILKVKSSYAYGKIEEIVSPSADRVPQDCPVYGKCGGCSLRHISYSAQLKYKQQAVYDAFTRIGKLTPEFLPIIENDSPDRYRNKLQMPAGERDGSTVFGFYAFHSHRIIPCDDCRLQPEIFSAIVKRLSALTDEYNIPVYSEETKRGALRHVYLRKGHYSGEICLCIVSAVDLPAYRKTAARLAEEFPAITSAVLNINPDDTNVILGEQEITLYGKPDITDTMCGRTVSVAPKAFYQVNTPTAEKIYRQAAEFARAEGKVILDLYCGAGTIGLSMADRAKKLIGVEIIPDAVENARRNAAANGITNAEFICADAGEAAKLLRSRGEHPDVIVIDPPRKGCGQAAAEQIAAFGAERLVMISCNPATAARDCAYFEQLGYKTEKVRAADMFSHTAHVECVVLMEGKNNLGEKSNES